MFSFRRDLCRSPLESCDSDRRISAEPEIPGLEIKHYWGETGSWSRRWTVLPLIVRFGTAEVKALFFGVVGTKKIQNALHRILGKVRQQPFNALEVTGIVTMRFLGMPYTIVSAHSRHIQQSWYLDERRGRWTSQIATWTESQVEHVLRFRNAVP
jgi:hypothetical protein